MAIAKKKAPLFGEQVHAVSFDKFIFECSRYHKRHTRKAAVRPSAILSITKARRSPKVPFVRSAFDCVVGKLIDPTCVAEHVEPPGVHI
jgi:hypothetical protein